MNGLEGVTLQAIPLVRGEVAAEEEADPSEQLREPGHRILLVAWDGQSMGGEDHQFIMTCAPDGSVETKGRQAPNEVPPFARREPTHGRPFRSMLARTGRAWPSFRPTRIQSSR